MADLKARVEQTAYRLIESQTFRLRRSRCAGAPFLKNQTPVTSTGLKAKVGSFGSLWHSIALPSVPDYCPAFFASPVNVGSLQLLKIVVIFLLSCLVIRFLDSDRHRK